MTEKNNKYDYYWYKENVEKYQKLYKQDFDLKNKYFLLAIGGTLAILIPLLEKFGSIIKVLLLLEISFLIVLGFLVLYSLLKEVEVHEKYVENYFEIYDKYGEQDITEENETEVYKKLNDNIFYDESIKNEKKIKFFFKIIIKYTVFLLFVIIVREIEMVGKKMRLETNSKQSEKVFYFEGIKPLMVKKGNIKESIEEKTVVEKDKEKKLSE